MRGLSAGKTYCIQVRGRSQLGTRPPIGGGTTYHQGMVTLPGEQNLGSDGNSGRSDPLANLPAEVTLSTSPTTVPEGTAVTVTATLSRSLSAAVTIPLTGTRGTSEDGNHGTLSAITITGGSLSGSETITTTSDADGDDETFTVAVNTATLPSGVSGGSPVSKTVTITDIHEGEVSTDPIFPSAPATFTAQAGDWQVVLSWGGVLLATGWEYSKDNGATWSTTGSASTGTTVTGLTNGTSYSFKVRAVRQLPAPFPSQTGRASSTVTATPVAGNGPTGQPTVSGTERVSHVLTATTSGIADQDGLSSPGWTYQWVRVEEGSTNTNITGATSATYTLAAADAGKKVRVKVSFTDDGNNAHTLESVDSGVIAAAHTTAPDPVAAVNVTHQGSSLTVSWNAPARATHYDVTYTNTSSGGNARAAWNRAGTSLTITCDSRPEHRNQSCVESSTPYTVGVRARNAGGESSWVDSDPATPPALSMANATAAEPGAGGTATLDFVVSLSHAAAAAVSVDYATSNGTAASGSLTFAAGETTKTVSVSVLKDAHDEGSETLTLTLSNVTGATIADGEGTGSVTNDDPIPQAWISRFGHTVAHYCIVL